VPDAPALPAATTEDGPRFVTGSTLRHVVVMTTTGSVGLVAIFAVDLISLLYISWLGEARLTAGVGFASIVLFFTTSINVGLMIAVGALVSRALGRRDHPAARRLAASGCAHTALAALLVSLIILPLLPWLLGLIGASAETLPVAQRFLWIALPSNVFMALGMALSAVLRAVGDAARAMYVTLAGGIATALLDPLLIFGLGLGIDGAALAVVASRVIFTLVGLQGAVGVHRLLGKPSLRDMRADAPAIYAVALPAVLTNIATPVAGGFFAAVFARFGDQAIAALAIIDRLVVVAFGGLFALSGAVGPILAQNWGAERFDRMHAALRDSVLLAALYVGTTWMLLVIVRHPLAALFNASGLTADLVVFFCLISGPLWFFNGLLFVANASFNNLGFPLLSTLFNWGRATLGTIPLAYLGARFAGPEGAVAAIGAGSFVFGIAALATAFWTIGRLRRRAARAAVAL